MLFQMTLLTLSGSLSQIISQTFPDIKQYWHFDNTDMSSYQTVFTLSQSYYQLGDTFLRVWMDTGTEVKVKVIVHTWSR